MYRLVVISGRCYKTFFFLYIKAEIQGDSVTREQTPRASSWVNLLKISLDLCPKMFGYLCSRQWKMFSAWNAMIYRNVYNFYKSQSIIFILSLNAVKTKLKSVQRFSSNSRTYIRMQNETRYINLWGIRWYKVVCKAGSAHYEGYSTKFLFSKGSLINYTCATNN